MRRVLVVEDDPQISFLVAATLTDDGFDVETAENGAVGMAKVRQNPPDLITLDVKMPVMGGSEFLRLYRLLPGCDCTPVLVLSATHQLEHESFENCEFLNKPFDLNDLSLMAERLTSSVP